LDKHEAQMVAETPEPVEKITGFVGRVQAGREAALTP
jgi:hypothetical protein